MDTARNQRPWECGPVAYEVASRAGVIAECIAREPQRFLSLRAVARLLGVSTQPVRDWIQAGHLHRSGPQNRLSREELRRFVRWLDLNAVEFYDDREARFHAKRRREPRPFDKLRHARFFWPKGRKALAPVELAKLVGCHPSLILRAIGCKQLRGHPRSPCRSEATLDAWRDAFLFSVVAVH